MVNLDVRSDPVPTALVELELADLLVEYLDQLGVEYVFGVPWGRNRTPLQRIGAQ